MSSPSPVTALTKALVSVGGWRAGVGRQEVDLVVDRDARLAAGAELVEDGLHGRLLAEEVRIGGVDHLEQQVGPQDLFERRAEGVDQVVRQLVDEPDRIGDDHLASARAG